MRLVSQGGRRAVCDRGQVMSARAPSSHSFR
nr:MAG TPA: hypothetical protein [Caudoviricetes sp.]